MSGGGESEFGDGVIDVVCNSLMSHRLTFSSILEEVPLKIRTNPLLSAFLGKLTETSDEGLPSATIGASSGLAPSFSVLDLGTGGSDTEFGANHRGGGQLPDRGRQLVVSDSPNCTGAFQGR